VGFGQSVVPKLSWDSDPSRSRHRSQAVWRVIPSGAAISDQATPPSRAGRTSRVSTSPSNWRTKSNIAERCGRGPTNLDAIRVLIRRPIDHATMPEVQSPPGTPSVLPLAPASSHACQVNLTLKWCEGTGKVRLCRSPRAMPGGWAGSSLGLLATSGSCRGGV
jgi:hypothetical protein